MSAADAHRLATPNDSCERPATMPIGITGVVAVDRLRTNARRTVVAMSQPGSAQRDLQLTRRRWAKRGADLARTRRAGETGGSLGAGRAGAFVVFAAALAVFLAVSADGATFGATSSGLASGNSSDPPSSTLVRPVETVDELVSVGGARMHVRCIGVGDTTLLLIAGFDDGGTTGVPSKTLSCRPGCARMPASVPGRVTRRR